MDNWKRIPTSREVWAVIHARHPDLRVYSSFSDPTGMFNGGAGECGRMDTAYCLPDADFPLIGARTTWDIGPGDARANEHHEYWLYAIKESE